MNDDELYLTPATAQRLADTVKQVENPTINLTPDASGGYRASHNRVCAVQITGTLDNTYKVYPARIVYHDYTEVVYANRWKQFTPDSLCWIYSTSVVTTALAVGDVCAGLLVGIYADGTPLFLHNTKDAGGTALDVRNTDNTAIDANTTSIRFNKTTGHIVSGTTGTSTVDGIDASFTQIGHINLSDQVLGSGNKTVKAGWLGINKITQYLYMDSWGLNGGPSTYYCGLNNNNVTMLLFDSINPRLVLQAGFLDAEARYCVYDKTNTMREGWRGDITIGYITMYFAGGIIYKVTKSGVDQPLGTAVS